MSSSLLKLGLAVSLVAASSAGVASADYIGPAAISDPASDIRIEASTSGLSVVIRNDDNDGSLSPWVWYTFDFENYELLPPLFFESLGDGYYLDYYRLDVELDCGTRGEIRVIDGASEVFVTFSVPQCLVAGQHTGHSLQRRRTVWRCMVQDYRRWRLVYVRHRGQ